MVGAGEGASSQWTFRNRLIATFWFIRRLGQHGRRVYGEVHHAGHPLAWYVVMSRQRHALPDEIHFNLTAHRDRTVIVLAFENEPHPKFEISGFAQISRDAWEGISPWRSPT